MTPDRSSAYGRVVKMLDDIGPAKLHAAEVTVLRDAADTLLFSNAHDAEVLEAVTVVDRLMRDLVEGGRWTAESAQRLSDDVAGCGPAMALA